MSKLIKTLIRTEIVGIIATVIGMGQISHNNNKKLNAISMCAEVL